MCNSTPRVTGLRANLDTRESVHYTFPLLHSMLSFDHMSYVIRDFIKYRSLLNCVVAIVS